VIIVLMGVAGSGKTTVGRLLAETLGWPFFDADDFHSPANIEKIRQGIPLTDEDRAPWLKAMRQAISGWIVSGIHAVLACSALKSTYRDVLQVSPDVQFVFLRGSYELLRQRLISRHGHFATDQILASQLETLEEPRDAVSVDITPPPGEIVGEIKAKLGLQ
jgi:gluconokinase